MTCRRAGGRGALPRIQGAAAPWTGCQEPTSQARAHRPAAGALDPTLLPESAKPAGVGRTRNQGQAGISRPLAFSPLADPNQKPAGRVFWKTPFSGFQPRENRAGRKGQWEWSAVLYLLLFPLLRTASHHLHLRNSFSAFKTLLQGGLLCEAFLDCSQLLHPLVPLSMSWRAWIRNSCLCDCPKP